jgi:hypothetical protein
MSEARSSHDAGLDVSQTALERLKRLIGDLDAEHPDWALVRRTFEAMPSCLAEWVEAHPDTGWLVPAMESMARSLPQLDSSDSRRYPTRGYYTERPIIAAMAVQPHEGVPPQFVRNLQAAILIAAAERAEEVASGEYISPLRSAGQSIRDVARKSLSSRLASDLGSARSIAELCDLVIDWLTVPEVWHPDIPQLELTSWDTKTLSGLRPLLRDISEQRALRHRAGGTRTVRKTRVESADRTDGPGPAAIGVEYSDSERRQMRDEGLSSSPENSSETFIADHPSSRNPGYSPDRLTEAQANRRTILRARAWKTSQQWTPNRTEILHPLALEALLATNQKWDHKAELRWEMLQLMLVAGAEAEDLRQCRVWPSLADVPTHPEVLGIIADTGTLVLPCPGMDDGWLPEKAFSAYFSDPAHKVDEYFRTAFRRLLLPLPQQLPASTALIKRARHIDSVLLYPGLSKVSKEQVVKALQKHVLEVNSTYHTALTLHRISMHVANAVYALDGDFAESLMLSYRHRQSNDHRLYYYAPEHNHLVRQHARIWQHLSHASDTGHLHSHSQLDHGYLGSAAVPLTSRLRETFTSLVDQIRPLLSGRGRRSKDTWRAAHNALTAYVIRQIQWTTGIRAIRDPIEIHNYDPTTGFLRINDKDSNDQYGARVVWLLPGVQRQIGIYLDHVERAAKALGVDQQQLTFRFVQDNNQIPEVSNQAMVRYTPCEYPYSINAHRHYLRTRLRELGVDAGYVDAWLGHGGTGREPYARHSTMAPARLRRAMLPALKTIREELGWVILPRIN